MIKEKNKKTLSIFPILRKSHSEKTTLNDLWNGDEIPYALKSSLAFVYCFHLKTANVFRRNGNEIAHESICNCLKRNMNTQPLLSIPMIYDVCSAIKAYVRDIPNGLLVKKLSKEWYRIAKIANRETVKRKLKIMIQKLPLANRNLLFNILVLGSSIIDNVMDNLMSSKALSIVLLPSLFEKVANFTEIKDLPFFVELLDIMIVNGKFIMEAELFQSIERNFDAIGNNLIIQPQHLDEDNEPLENDKRNFFISVDSGLNSTSFLDDKGSQSLSGSSQARANRHGDGSSMEDLLNESDCINVTTTSIESDDNGLHKSDSILSISSSISSHNNDNLSYNNGNCIHGCMKQKLDSSFSCIGTKIHSINECRPFSMYGSPTNCHDKWDSSEHNHQCYIPVYDRSCFSIENNYSNTKAVIEELEEKKPIIYKSTFNIQRQKPIIRKTTCAILPLEVKHPSSSSSSSSSISSSSSLSSILHSSSSTITITAQSIAPDTISNNDLCTISHNSSQSSVSSNNNNISNTNIILKYKPKRSYNPTRSRYTAPIRISDDDVWCASNLIRTTSMNNQSNLNIAVIDE